jgi:hypothetical protein
MVTTSVGVVGLSVGAGVGGVIWFYLRAKERKALVDALQKSRKIKMMQTLAPHAPVPPDLEGLVRGEFEAEAEKQISFTNSETAEEALKRIHQKVQTYIDSVPEEGLDRLKELLGIDDAIVGKIKQVLTFFKGQKAQDKARP